MFARLSRLFRAWMGFFISMGEDPEVMLQDAIEEMRMTMPKLNSVLVATRATVIRLEEERDALLRQDTQPDRRRFRRRFATARPRRAAWPKKTRSSCSSFAPIWPSTQEQLAAAAKAHESAKMSVDALKAKLKEQDRDEPARAEGTPEGAGHEESRPTRSSSCSPTASRPPPTSSSSRSSRKSPNRRRPSKWRPAAIDTQAIERERTARKLKAAGILQQFEAEMGISAPPTAAELDRDAERRQPRRRRSRAPEPHRWRLLPTRTCRPARSSGN